MLFIAEPSIVANVSVTLTFDSMTLKTFSAMPTHMMNIYASCIEISLLSRRTEISHDAE